MLLHVKSYLYYTYGRILEAKGETDKAYDFYYKAYWAADSVAKAMTRIALIDLKRKDFAEAVRHAENALDYGRNNNLATSALVIALRELGEKDHADSLLKKQLERDSLDHLARFISGAEDFYTLMDSDPLQTCLDLAADLSAFEGQTVNVTFAAVPKAEPDSLALIAHVVNVKVNVNAEEETTEAETEEVTE